MPITSINRDNYVGGPSIVRLTTSDTINVATAEGYLTAQSTIIALLNNGDFDWAIGDMVALFASDGNGIFQFSGNDFSTLIPLDSGDLPSNVVLNDKLNTMANANSALYAFNGGTFTEDNSGIVTANCQCGRIITRSLTTAPGDFEIITMNNPLIKNLSAMFFTTNSLGTSNVGIELFYAFLAPSAGQCQIQITNGNASALNGTIGFYFYIAS